MIRIDYKPLSINEAYTGRRFKTALYKAFSKGVTLMLRPQKLPDPPYKITLIFGQSNIEFADWDGPVKNFQDVLCKKLGINDRLIYKGDAEKVFTPKGKEFIMYKIEHHTPINLNDLCGATTEVKQTL